MCKTPNVLGFLFAWSILCELTGKHSSTLLQLLLHITKDHRIWLWNLRQILDFQFPISNFQFPLWSSIAFFVKKLCVMTHAHACCVTLFLESNWSSSLWWGWTAISRLWKESQWSNAGKWMNLVLFTAWLNFCLLKVLKLTFNSHQVLF